MSWIPLRNDRIAMVLLRAWPGQKGSELIPAGRFGNLVYYNVWYRVFKRFYKVCYHVFTGLRKHILARRALRDPVCVLQGVRKWMFS